MKHPLVAIACVMNVFLIAGMDPAPLRARVGQKISIKIVQYGNIRPCLSVDHPDKSILGFEGVQDQSVELPEAEYPYNSRLRNTIMYTYTAIRPGKVTLTFWTGERTNERKQTRTIVVEL